MLFANSGFEILLDLLDLGLGRLSSLFDQSSNLGEVHPVELANGWHD